MGIADKSQTTEVANGKLITVSVPSSAEASREYVFNLHEPGGLGILMTMSDSSGFGTGGSTPVIGMPFLSFDMGSGDEHFAMIVIGETAQWGWRADG